ncbi:MAG TPA: hypothetical protein VMH88_14050 [Gemmatimonadales bacterium]|nr:hypothetical protein [Gemmatimonadales bacterium]
MIAWVGRGLAWTTAVATAACVSTTDSSGQPPVALTGAWDYAAIQTTPTPATLSGTLTVASQAGHAFQGSIDVMEVDSASGVFHFTGPVSGEALDSTTLDFDVFLTATARRHVGTVAHDSMSGSWVEQGGMVTKAGSFRAARRAAS